MFLLGTVAGWLAVARRLALGVAVFGHFFTVEGGRFAGEKSLEDLGPWGAAASLVSKCISWTLVIILEITRIKRSASFRGLSRGRQAG